MMFKLLIDWITTEFPHVQFTTEFDRVIYVYQTFGRDILLLAIMVDDDQCTIEASDKVKIKRLFPVKLAARETLRNGFVGVFSYCDLEFFDKLRMILNNV